jgi:hypothetical protein
MTPREDYCLAASYASFEPVASCAWPPPSANTTTVRGRNQDHRCPSDKMQIAIRLLKAGRMGCMQLRYRSLTHLASTVAAFGFGPTRGQFEILRARWRAIIDCTADLGRPLLAGHDKAHNPVLQSARSQILALAQIHKFLLRGWAPGGIAHCLLTVS